MRQRIMITSTWHEFQGDTLEIKGIKRLAHAMIVRAILDSKGLTSGAKFYTKKANQPQEIIRTAIEWLLKSENIEAPSFYWCCEILGIEPDRLRKYLLSPKNNEKIQRFLYSRQAKPK